MAALDPATVAKRWADHLGASADRIRSGVAAVTVAPGQAAARQKSLYVANVTAKADVWAARTGAVSLADWQNHMTGKGIDRIAGGAAAAVDKMTVFMQKLLPFIASQRATLPPRGSYEQNKARMTQWVDKMHGFKK